MIEVAAGQQLISDLQPFLKILQWSHALILLEHDTSMKPRPGSAASSHRDLAKPEVKRLVYLGKWMVARGSFLLGWFNLFSGANLLKKLQGGVHVMFVSWCFECFFQLFQLTLLNFKSVAWEDGFGPRRAWPTASCAKAGFSSLLGKWLGVGKFDVRCRAFFIVFPSQSRFLNGKQFRNPPIESCPAWESTWNIINPQLFPRKSSNRPSKSKAFDPRNLLKCLYSPCRHVKEPKERQFDFEQAQRFRRQVAIDDRTCQFQSEGLLLTGFVDNDNNSQTLCSCKICCVARHFMELA